MMTLKNGPTPLATVSGGAFDTLPGAPWRTPPLGDFSGFAIPAMLAMRNYNSDEVGEATFSVGEIELTVRVIDTIADPTGRSMRVMQFIAEEFEVLALFPEDMQGVHLSFRGGKAAFVETAEVLRAVGGKAMANRSLGSAN